MKIIDNGYCKYAEIEEGETIDWSIIPKTNLNAIIHNKAFNVVTRLGTLFSLSHSEIKRRIGQGALSIDGEKIKTGDFVFHKNKEYQIRLGKEFRRVLYV